MVDLVCGSDAGSGFQICGMINGVYIVPMYWDLRVVEVMIYLSCCLWFLFVCFFFN